MVRTPNVRRVAGAVRALPIPGLLLVPARVAGFIGAERMRALRPVDAIDGLPAVALTRSLVAQVALDELVLAMMKRPDRYPTPAEVERVVSELEETAAVHRAHGWDSDPLSYHRTPPPLTDSEISAERWMTTRFERLTWHSEYDPWEGLPGRDRWLADERNATAHALVLRHRDRPRPWVVCLHGLGTGVPMADLPGFRVRHLHHVLGMNVLLPVLPKHGLRGAGRLGAQTVLTYDHSEAVLAVAQAVWDVRRAVGWAREHGGDVALHGISFGGLVAGLLAALDDDYAAVIAGIPVVDIPQLFSAHVPWLMRHRAWLADILGDVAAEVHRVISPLSGPPLVPAARRYIYAGVGDRMVPPSQARALAGHWTGSRILWFSGDHIGATWSRDVRAFIDTALVRHLPIHLGSGEPGAAAGESAQLGAAQE